MEIILILLVLPSYIILNVLLFFFIGKLDSLSININIKIKETFHFRLSIKLFFKLILKTLEHL